MKITYRTADPLAETADAVILPLAATDGGALLTDAARQIDEALSGELTRLAADARFTGKRGQTLVVPTLGRTAARRAVLAGLGSAEKLDEEAIRRALAAGSIAARDVGARSVVATAPSADGLDASRVLAAAAEGAALATYRFTRYHGTARKENSAPKEIETLTFAGALDAIAGAAALARAAAIAGAVTLARDLVNEPASVLNPLTMEAHARAVAEEHGLEIKVLGPKEMDAHGMGAIRAVGKGSNSEPRLIHLVYRPEGATAGTRQIGIVGKCITFDTGGYSIKPHDGMLEMKTDMAGGAAVLGAMTALKALGCRHVVHGVLCAAENMISGEAFRPGDILTAMNGVTIEILSTDAEGRLVLADGLVYTARQGVQELIDLATLTGAAVVALGDGTTALFANDDALAERLQSAATVTGERLWRMPLTEALEEKIKGDVGDLKNSGGRQGGAITAALFLQHFCEGVPWAHLDIAGAARAPKSTGYTPKGATGVGVRTLLAYVTA
ncbi:MAG: leucyl aminopeptidase [Thermomicrobiales bacterium]